MKTPAEWGAWCDAFWTEHKRYPWWHELVTAVQEDAYDSNQSKNGTADDVARRESVPNSQTDAVDASSPSSPSHETIAVTSSGSADATAEGN